MDESLTPEKILHRLEELRKWQKIQEERLRQQQILQRKELEEEQKRFLESLSTSQRELAMQASDDDKSYLSTNSFYYDSPKAPAEDVQSRLSLHCNVMDGVSPLNISNESEPRLSPALSSALESGHSQKYDSEHSDQYHNRSRDLEKYTLNSVEYGNDNTDQPHASFHLEKSHNSGKYHDDYKSGKSDDVDTHIYHKPSAIEKAGQKNNQTNKSKTKPKLNDLPNIPQIKDSISMNPYQMSKKSTLQSIKKIAGANDNSNSKTIPVAEKFSQNSNKHNMDEGKTQVKLDDLQIIPMAKDFNSLLESKIKSNDAGISSQQSKKTTQNLGHKKSKPFLKRGQGMVRFNMKTDDIGLVKNKKLPWTKKKVGNNNSHVARKEKLRNDIHSNENNDKLRNDIPSNENNDKVDNIELYDDKLKLTEAKICYKSKKKLDYLHQTEESYSPMSPQKSPVSDSNLHDQSESLNFSEDILTLMRSKKTWASLLTEEQEYYIKILRETSKYKHLFDDSDHNNSSDYSTIASPSLEKVKHDKEIAEQRMFDMLEKKVDNSSFCSTGSFVAKVIGYRGTDTPTANREYVKSFPHVLNLKPSLSDLKTIENLDSSKESLDTVRTKEDTSRDENSNPKDDEHSEDNADTDKDEYSDSTDTEPTCKISLNQGISTSTPNQAQMQKRQYKLQRFLYSHISNTEEKSY